MPSNRPFEPFTPSVAPPKKEVLPSPLPKLPDLSGSTSVDFAERLLTQSNFVRYSRFRSLSFLQSVGFAWQGFQYLARNERNFKIHLVLAVVAFVTAAFVGFERWEWIILLACTALMLCTEAFNTAIELLVDLIVGDEQVPLAGRIKDIAAAACLMMATALGTVGAFLFLPHLWALALPLFNKP